MTRTAFQDLVNEENIGQQKDLLLRIGFTNQTYIAFIVNEIEIALNAEIIPQIREKMNAHGFSHKISDAVHIAGAPVAKSPGLIAWTIISDYKALDGFPVAVMMEKGRKAYKVFPLDPEGWLHWVAKDGSNVFSKKSKIPRMPATNYVRDITKARTPFVQARIDSATQRYVDDILKGS